MIFKLNLLLNDSISRAGIKKQVDSALVLDKFEKILVDILSKEISSHIIKEIKKDIKPLYLKNRVLTIASLNDSLNQEIRLREKTILYRLNSEMGQNVAGKIMFVI